MRTSAPKDLVILQDILPDANPPTAFDFCGPVPASGFQSRGSWHSPRWRFSCGATSGGITDYRPNVDAHQRAEKRFMRKEIMNLVRERDIEIPAEAGAVRLPGTLTFPPSPIGLVVFAHGSGSSRLSPRNRAVALNLAENGLATLLFDLLTDAEAEDRANVFDIPLLARRVVEAVQWARKAPDLHTLPIGLFGSSTGAAAALVAAATIPDEIGAVVSRGGRPDLAGEALGVVKAPTLLVVGGADHAVIELNQSARRALTCASSLEIVPGATHLFEEPGTLEEVERLATEWFCKWLPGGKSG